MNAKRKLTAQEKRNLDFEISFMERLVERDPKYVEALQILGIDYIKRGNYEAGLKTDRKLVRLMPGDPTVLYNFACSLALTNRYKQAVATLEKAIDAGFDDYRLLMRDPDLAKIRRDPAFDRIREKLLNLPKAA